MGVQIIPKEIWYRVIINLNQQDLYTLAQVNVFFRTIINDDYIWRQCLIVRYGENALPCPTLENPPTCREVYEDKAQLKISITTFNGPWFDDRRYWLMQPSDESVFGKIAYLNLVWWLDISTTIPAVAPGAYEIIWRLKFDNYLQIFPFTLFVEPVLDNTDIPEAVSFQQNQAQGLNIDWVEAVAPKRFVVEEKHGFIDVKVGIKNIDSSMKSRISFDYVHLRALNRSEVTIVPNTLESIGQ